MKKRAALLLSIVAFAFITAAPVFAQSRSFKQAIRFTPSSSGLYSELRLPVDTFTVESWVKLAPFDTETKVRYIFTSRDTLSGTEVSLRVSGNSQYNDGKGFLTAFASPYTMTSSVMLAPNIWYHVALTKSETGYTLFVDGTQAATQSHTGSMYYANQLGITVGGWPAGTWEDPYFGYTDRYLGELDELRISDSARYAAGFTPSKSTFPADTHTLGLYRLNKTLLDSSVLKNPLMGLASYPLTFVKSTVGR